MRKMRNYLRQNYAKILFMKLPKPRKRGDAYRIEIMLNGKRLGATRDTIKECEQWATQKILEAKAYGALPQSEKDKSPMTLHQLMILQFEKVRKQAKGKRYDLDMQRQLPRDFEWLTSKRVVDITPADIQRFRDARLANVKSSTVIKNIGYLSSVIEYAVAELHIITSNPCKVITKPTPPPDRYRRITQAEIDDLLTACDYKVGNTPLQGKHWVGWSFIWGIESAMRRGEIFGMTWGEVYANYVHLPDTKTDDPRNVPLSPVMRELLACLPNADKHKPTDKLIVIDVEGFKSAWQRVILKTTIKDLQFRDTRHEAISRFVRTQRLPVEIVAKITGHKKIETLVNVYYNPTADELYEAMYGDK